MFRATRQGPQVGVLGELVEVDEQIDDDPQPDQHAEGNDVSDQEVLGDVSIQDLHRSDAFRSLNRPCSAHPRHWPTGLPSVIEPKGQDPQDRQARPHEHRPDSASLAVGILGELFAADDPDDQDEGRDATDRRRH